MLCTGIQGIYALFVWGVHQPKKVCLPSTSLASRWGSICQRRLICQILVSLVGGGSICRRKFVCQGVHWQGKVHLPVLLVGGVSIGRRRFICWDGPSAEEGSSARFELTCSFMLCFTEGLFVLHTKDLIKEH